MKGYKLVHAVSALYVDTPFFNSSLLIMIGAAEKDLPREEVTKE